MIVEGSEEGEENTGTRAPEQCYSDIHMQEYARVGCPEDMWWDSIVVLGCIVKGRVRMDHAVLEMWTRLRRIGEIR